MEVGSAVTGSATLSNVSATLTASKTTGSAVATDVSGNIAAATSSSEAYSLEISSTGASVSLDEGQTHGDAVKGLTSEQIDVLQAGIDKAYETMIKVLSEQNLKMQGWLDDGIGNFKDSDFGDIVIGADRFGLPAVGTTPEEAAAAVAEGGAYSVDSVADRLFSLATAIAGDDVEKLQKMQNAIAEGFDQATSIFKDATGAKNMPEITQKTQDAINKLFEDRYAEILKNTASAEALGQAGTANAATEAANNTANDNNWTATAVTDAEQVAASGATL